MSYFPAHSLARSPKRMPRTSSALRSGRKDIFLDGMAKDIAHEHGHEGDVGGVESMEPVQDITGEEEGQQEGGGAALQDGEEAVDEGREAIHSASPLSRRGV